MGKATGKAVYADDLAFPGMAEQALVTGQGIDAAVAALQTEIAPIDDVRSTAEYRRLVAGNLLRQFWTHATGEPQRAPNG